MRSSSKIFVLLILSMLVLFLARCVQHEPKTSESPYYLNHSDTVKYVGIQTCRQCHSEIYNTYVETGMGSSFHPALRTHSSGSFDGRLLHDSLLNYTYQPSWKQDSLWLREFRMLSDDTIYSRSQRIDYIVGSGQHTNSHLYVNNGYLYQAPFTWYAQEEKLDLPPGFEHGANSRFSRQIGLECTSCHNAMPVQFVMGSVNKYVNVPAAIDCERCHGPGELHVKRMQLGQIVDTATAIDYSIVNVGKLPAQLQFETCQRCHLQGNSVLKGGKSFLDFRPGMELKEVMDVYIPRFSDSDDEFIMASHADRLKQSLCVQEHEDFNCTSCHNPHISVKQTNSIKYNKVCSNCHSKEKLPECSATVKDLQAADFDCVSCHMPLSESTDIPHVSIHDHRIQIPKAKTSEAQIRKFMELAAINNPDPSYRSKALAYLQQYERFEPEAYYLDSAAYFLDRVEAHEDRVHLEVYYYFLKGDYNRLSGLIEEWGVESVLSILNKKDLMNTDSWTAYRIAEAYKGTGKYDRAEEFYKRSIDLMPYNADLYNKYGSLLMLIRKQSEARKMFERALEINSNHREALNNLGYNYMLSGKLVKAKEYFRKALQVDHDYGLAWKNLASVHLQMEMNNEAKEALRQAVRLDPRNEQLKALYQSL